MNEDTNMNLNMQQQKSPIQIYTLPTCSDCAFAKRYFEEHGFPYTEYNCAEQESYRREVWELTGKQTVPTLVIRGEVFVGFADNLPQIAKLLGMEHN